MNTSIYKLQKVPVSGNVVRYLIVFLDERNLLTNYSVANKYIELFKGHKRRKSYNGEDYIRDIIAFLNYLGSKGINPEDYLSEITIDDANEFMSVFCSRVGKDGEPIKTGSRVRMQRNIARFLINIRDSGINEALKGHYIRNRDNGQCEIMLIKTDSKSEKETERYCPKYFVDSFLAWAHVLKLNCWIAAVFCYLAGLRPSEACNLTHPDSIYGGNVKCTYINDKIAGMEIDLEKEAWERPLRSDGIPVGDIKRPRPQIVLPQNVDVLHAAYQEYLFRTASMPREEYGPLIIQQRKSKIYQAHMAYRYINYYQDFKMICENYVWPELIAMGGEPEYYARKMMESKYGMHMFRHGFSSKLAAETEEWKKVMEARGDSPNNPDTAAMYVIKGGGMQRIVDDASEELAKDIKKKGDSDLPPLPRSI